MTTAPDLSLSGRSCAICRDAGGGGWWSGLFWTLVLVMAGSHFLVPHLPMADLPQHAAQVAALADIMRNNFRWHELVTVNFLTPYLAAYPLAALLALAMPVHAAIACILAAAFLACIWTGLLLRRQAQAPAFLDFLLIPGFFGASWHIGGLTFLAAAPLVLLFVYQARIQSDAPSGRRALYLLALGILLFWAHVLAFAFACLCGGCYALLTRASRSRQLLLIWPYAVFALMLLAYPLLRGPDTQDAATIMYGSLEARLANFFHYPFSGDVLRPEAPLFYLFWLAPFLLGYRPDLTRIRNLVPFGCFLLLWAFLPTTMFGTHLLYQRFAVFAMPFYILMFRSGSPPAARWAPETRYGMTTLMILLVARHCLLMLAFGAESRSISALLQQLEPGRRLYTMVSDAASPAFGNRGSYAYFAHWYEVEQHGWVDFNYAFFFPQVVVLRDRNAYAPLYDLERSFGAGYNWNIHHGRSYDYFLLRGQTPGITDIERALLTNGECDIRLKTEVDGWKLYERTSCR